MNIKKRTIGILSAAVMLFAVPVTVSAYSFSLSMPNYFVGSMRSTSLQKKTSYTTPYVSPSVNTVPTDYFLSPQRIDSTLATNILNISNATRHNFTWKSGYGGINTSYCLSAYPHMTGSWDAYTTRGTWSN